MTTASPKSQVRIHNAGAAPTLGALGFAALRLFIPTIRSAFEGEAPPYVLTTRWSILSATCFSQFSWLDSCSCHSSSDAFSPADSGLYGTALHGLLQGISYVGSTVCESPSGIVSISVMCSD